MKTAVRFLKDVDVSGSALNGQVATSEGDVLIAGRFVSRTVSAKEGEVVEVAGRMKTAHGLAFWTRSGFSYLVPFDAVKSMLVGSVA